MRATRPGDREGAEPTQHQRRRLLDATGDRGRVRATVALARRTETASVTPKLHYPKLGIPDSVAVVYNTFPMPPNDSDMSRLGALGQAVADARAAHPGATLADLYDPDLMPSNLRPRTVMSSVMRWRSCVMGLLPLGLSGHENTPMLSLAGEAVDDHLSMREKRGSGLAPASRAARSASTCLV